MTALFSIQLTRCWLLLFLLLCCVSASSAQTFLSGNLAGTLTPAGNPFEVVGHCVVPQDSTLTLQAGVRLQFSGDNRLIVRGVLNAEGTLSDSVIIRADSATHPFMGSLWIANPTTFSQLRFTSISGSQAVLKIGDTTNSGRVQISRSLIRGASNLTGGGCQFIADSSTLFNCGVEGITTLNQCRIYYNWFGVTGTCTITNSTLTSLETPPNSDFSCLRGQLTLINVVSDTNSRIVASNSQLTAINVTGNPMVTGFGTDATFTDSRLTSLGYGSTRGHVQIRRTHCLQYVSVGGNAAVFDIDSLHTSNFGTFQLTNACSLTVRRSLFDNITGAGIGPTTSFALGNATTLLDRCTIVRRGYTSIDDTVLIGMYAASTLPVTIRNCVLHNPYGNVIRRTNQTLVTLEYNAIESPNPFQGVTAGATNVIGALRLVDFRRGNDSLRTYSCAIDAADLLLPPDADGSRADCGSIPYDHRVNHAPEVWQDTTAIQTWVLTRDTLRNRLVLIDDHTNIVVTAQAIPQLGASPTIRVIHDPTTSWDTVQISAFLSGNMPANGTIHIVATDSGGVSTEVRVRYEFYPYGLSGQLHDTTLTNANGIVWINGVTSIPRGDTVRVLPGTIVRAIPLPNQSVGFAIWGCLEAIGMANDSIELSIYDSQNNLPLPWDISLYGGTLVGSYLKLPNGIYTDAGTVTLSLSHSSLKRIYSMYTAANITITSSTLYDSETHIIILNRLFLANNQINKLNLYRFSDSCFVNRCTFSTNGGGIYCNNRTDFALDSIKLLVDSSLFSNASINDNSLTRGGFIQIHHSIFTHSTIFWRGSEDIVIKRSLFNRGSSIRQYSAINIPNITIVNSQFLSNPVAVYRDNYAPGLPQLNGNLFWNNDTNFQNNIVPQLGVVSTVNRNGDSTDVYGNLYLNPLIQDSTVFPWSFGANSPVLDGGVIDSLPYFGAAPNIGPWEQPRTDAGEPPLNVPLAFQISAPYPNPTNGAIVVSLALPKKGLVSLQIVNVLGQSVYEQQADLASGHHQLTIKLPNSVSTGYYLLTVAQGDENANRRFLYLK